MERWQLWIGFFNFTLLQFNSWFSPKSDAVYLEFSMILQNTLYAIYIVKIRIQSVSNEKWLMINFIISVTVVSIFIHTPLKVVWFVLCICYSSDSIHFLHCLVVDILDQQLYTKPKGGMGGHFTLLRLTCPK